MKYDCIRENFRTEYDAFQSVSVGRSINNKSTYGRNINVDRSYYAREWNANHGMTVVALLQAKSGTWYEIWESDRLSCAVPVYERK